MPRYSFHSPTTIFTVFIHHETAVQEAKRPDLQRLDVCKLLVRHLADHNEDLLCVMVRPMEAVKLSGGEVISNALGEVINNNWATGFSRRTTADRYEVLFQLKVARPTETEKKWAFELLQRPMFPGLHAVSIPPMGAFDYSRILSFIDDYTVVDGPKDDSKPRLDHSTMLLYLERFDKGADDLEVVGAIQEHYTATNVGYHAIFGMFREWAKRVGRADPPSRLQTESCSIPAKLRLENPDDWKHPFVHENAPEELRYWPANYLGKPVVRLHSKTMVFTGLGGRGRTHYIRSWGPHIYLYKSVDRELIYDCIQDGDAQYIVLDDVPWPTLLQHYENLLTGQKTLSFKSGRHNLKTIEPLPVIIIANGPPMRYYGNRGEAYFRDFLQFVALDPDNFLYDRDIELPPPAAEAPRPDSPTAAVMEALMPRLQAAVRQKVATMVESMVEVVEPPPVPVSEPSQPTVPGSESSQSPVPVSAPTKRTTRSSTRKRKR